MFAITLINLILKIQYVLDILILINVILSWLPPMDNVFTQAVYSVTEPLLKPFRNLLYSVMNLPIDISPIILGFVINIVTKILIRLIITLYS